ncbi:hypothetical protein GE21DRAFT_1118269 [Neurospora crassa]|nr:hypothetical protein GE21DRAFT_1118269 [Neurospora crassa]
MFIAIITFFPRHSRYPVTAFSSFVNPYQIYFPASTLKGPGIQLDDIPRSDHIISRPLFLFYFLFLFLFFWTDVQKPPFVSSAAAPLSDRRWTSLTIPDLVRSSLSHPWTQTPDPIPG